LFRRSIRIVVVVVTHEMTVAAAAAVGFANDLWICNEYNKLFCCRGPCDITELLNKLYVDHKHACRCYYYISRKEYDIILNNKWNIRKHNIIEDRLNRNVDFLCYRIYIKKCVYYLNLISCLRFYLLLYIKNIPWLIDVQVSIIMYLLYQITINRWSTNLLDFKSDFPIPSEIRITIEIGILKMF